jgi:molybdopterin-guanine dinucleotide biosynthesis protein A
VKFAGVVLAGGKSSRFGSDKSLHKIDGRSLTARAAQTLLDAGCDPVLVLGPPKDYGLPKGVRRRKDKRPGLGPLGGLESALSALKRPLLVLACDLPGMKAATLRRLGKALKGKDAVLAAGGGRQQPLAGAYHPRVLKRARQRLRNGEGSMFGFLSLLRVQWVAVAHSQMKNWNSGGT